VLRFEDNRLTVLGDGEFSSYANLQEIYLARNRIELIEATAFRGLFSLQILDIEANRLSAVPDKSLRAVATSLRLLNLKNNPIRRLEANSLSSLTRLEEARILSLLVGILDGQNVLFNCVLINSQQKLVKYSEILLYYYYLYKHSFVLRNLFVSAY